MKGKGSQGASRRGVPDGGAGCGEGAGWRAPGPPEKAETPGVDGAAGPDWWAGGVRAWCPSVHEICLRRQDVCHVEIIP